MKSILSILLFGLFSFLMLNNQKDYAFEVKMEKGGSFQVFAVHDDKGVLEKYTADITAPVCEEGVCYDVHLVFNWNIIGEFTDFEVLPKSPLTKLDHIPFEAKDYAKLQSILTNPDLNFVQMSAKELVENPDEPKVDGVSGATKEAIKEEIIEGALYTCYTLWHIANGVVVDSIGSFTKSKMDKSLVNKIIDLKSQTANYFIINNLTKVQFEENIADILVLIKNGKGYFSKNAIEQIPSDLFQIEPIQQFLTKNYADLDYYTQVAALKQLDSVKLNTALASMFINKITEKNRFQNQKLVALLLKQVDKDILEKLMTHLVKKKVGLSSDNYVELEKKCRELNVKMIGVERKND